SSFLVVRDARPYRHAYDRRLTCGQDRDPRGAAALPQPPKPLRFDRASTRLPQRLSRRGARTGGFHEVGVSHAMGDSLPPSNGVPDSAGLDAGLRSTERKVRAGFALALACLAVVGAVSYLSVLDLDEHAAWVGHTQQVLSRLELLLASVTDLEAAERGYVITGDEGYLEPYRQSAQSVDAQVRSLQALTADNRIQQQRLAEIVPLVNDRLANLRAVIET